nr:unnamed protein product [Spirometra erinaceieuropaei]
MSEFERRGRDPLARSDAQYQRSADGKVEIDDQVKASLLSDFFQSVFTREPSAIFAHPSSRQPTSPPSTLPHPIPSLPSLTEEPLFSSTIVSAELLRLKPAKSPGPDRIPALALRTPTYGLAKWLFRRLKFLTAGSDTTVSSSAQFLEKLKGDLAIETIELLLQSKYDETDNRLGHAQVLQLLKLCLKTYFTFDGTIYEQVKGTPMGSPISGFIAEAVLQRLESLVFQHHKPKFWARYVDDTFVVIDRDQLLTFK